MNIDELIKELNDKTNEEKINIIKKHIVRNYVPYAEKISRCMNIIKNTSYDGDGNFNQNTAFRHALFLLNIVDSYTDIDFEYSIEIFDKLCETNIIFMILAEVSESDMKLFDSVLNMVSDDEYANNRDLVSFLESKFIGIEAMINPILDYLSSTDGGKNE